MGTVKKVSIKPAYIVLAGDQLLICVSLLSAFWGYKNILPQVLLSPSFIFSYTAINSLYAVALCSTFKTNKKIIRFFHNTDYLQFIAILGLINLLSYCTVWLFFNNPGYVHAGIAVISFFISSLYIVLSRLLISEIRLLAKKAKQQAHKKRLLIYGAGEIGAILQKAIAVSNSNTFQLVGFLDDDAKKTNRLMGGIPIYNTKSNLKDTILKNNITDIIIATHKISVLRKDEFFKEIVDLQLNVREITSLNYLLEHNFNINNFSIIDISKLLNRPPIELYNEYVEETLTGKKILVTGAAGSIGSEIVRKLSEHNAGLIVCLDFSESALYDLQQEMIKKFPEVKLEFVLADVRDEEIMYNIFTTYAPHFIYHAASYKHVPLMEQFPWHAIQTNVVATWKLIKLAVSFKAEKFVFISTDKAVKPTSIMGATKRLAEIILQAYSSGTATTCFAITRFGNVLGSNGSVVPLFKKQIAWGGPVTITHPEMTRYFMTISEACQLVLEASVMAEGGEIFLFDMGTPFKIVDLARNMIKMAGYIPDVNMHIKFIGQRPGEKLYEELFLETEKMQKTYHEKIMISKEDARNFNEAKEIIYKLQALEGFYDPQLFQKIIKEILPEYHYSPAKTLVAAV